MGTVLNQHLTCLRSMGSWSEEEIGTGAPRVKKGNEVENILYKDIILENTVPLPPLY